MSFAMRILIGFIIGILFGFFYVINAVNKKEKKLKTAYEKLSKALSNRYSSLIKLLRVLDKYMYKFKNEINELIELCESAAEFSSSIKDIEKKLELENKINYKLEIIKSNMGEINQNAEVQNIVVEIIQNETAAGNAIKTYNNVNLEYTVFTTTFPISIAAWILDKDTEIPPFQVTSAIEFDESYIDENEI